MNATKLSLLAAAGALMAVLYVAMVPKDGAVEIGTTRPGAGAEVPRPGDAAASDASGAAAAPASPAAELSAPIATPVPAVRVLSTDGASATTLTVLQGDTLQIDIRAAAPGAVSIHGLSVADHPVQPGLTRITVAAAMLGRFPVHFHGRRHEHAAMGTLEIRPR